MVLLDFAVYGHFTQYGVVLLELNAVGRVLAVLLGDVTAGARLAGGLVLGAFQDDEVAITF